MTILTVDTLPTELLDIVLSHAVAYTGAHDVGASPLDPPNPFAVVCEPATRMSRWSVLLVNKRWSQLAISHIYRDIRLVSHTHADVKFLHDVEWLARKFATCSSTDRPACLVRTLTIQMPVMDLYSASQNTKVVEHLLAILAHVTLCRFATTVGEGIDFRWLRALCTSSARTLTHLELTVHPGVIFSETVEYLNRLGNLDWLGISDRMPIPPDNRRDADNTDPLEVLPRLSLPRLREIHLACIGWTPEMAPNFPIPFFLGKNASLPVLQRLTLHAPELENIDDILEPFLKAFGSNLLDLRLQLYDLRTLQKLDILAPKLTDLTCMACLCPDEREILQDDTMIIIHPTLRRLTIDTELSLLNVLCRIDPAVLPHLREITVAGFSWPAATYEMLHDESDGTARIVRAAARLRSAGIRVLDREGKVFRNEL